MENKTILIIGAGIFGVSTAYHLAQRVSDPSRITLLDRATSQFNNNNTAGASADINKIIRADYSSPLYTDLAFEAIEAWKTLPILRDAGVYHQSGWIALNERDSDLAARVRANFRSGNHDDRAIIDMTAEEARRACGGLLDRTDWSPFESCYFNPLAGWADAGRALEVMCHEAIRLGVRYQSGEVRRIVSGEREGDGVQGVETESGTVFQADIVLLATGAWTSKLMASLEDALDLPYAQRVERRVSAAGVCVAHFQLSDEEKEAYSRLPVLVYGGQGEVIPPTSSGILKFTSSTSFKNTIHTATGHEISVPVQNQADAPRGLQEDLISAVRARLPQLLDHGRRPDYYRLCWDSISPDQHPLITRHPDPRLSNLYLAVGGSFHFYKFLPVIGKYVVNVLEGVGNGPVRDQAWAWKVNETGERGVHEALVPRKEFRDFV